MRKLEQFVLQNTLLGDKPLIVLGLLWGGYCTYFYWASDVLHAPCFALALAVVDTQLALAE